MNKLTKLWQLTACSTLAILSIVCIGPLWKPNIKKLMEPIDSVEPTEREREQDFVSLIDNASERFARWCNRKWRKDIIQRVSNPNEQRLSSVLFASVLNSAAEKSGSKMRITVDEIEKGVGLDLHNQKQLWKDLTGKRGTQEGLDEELNRVVQNGEQEEELEDIIASLPKLIGIPRSGDSSNRDIVQEIADLTL